MPSDYRIRPATLDDADVLVRHRVGMFTDMGLTMDVARLETTFRAWLGALMPAGTYRAWLVETADGRIVGGGGITILPWPPGPSYAGDRLAFVYNVYVEPRTGGAASRASSWTPSTRSAAPRASRRWR